MVVILGRRTKQRDPTDVDRFDRLGMARPGRNRLTEGIEVDDDQVDQWQLAVGELLEMARLIAARQDAGMHRRMQGLPPAAEQLGESGELRKAVNGTAGFLKNAFRPAGGIHRDLEIGQAAGEVDQARLVGDAQQGVHTGNGSAWFAIRFTTSGSSWCSSRWILARKVSMVSFERTATRRWARIGPPSTSSVTTWTVQPDSATPAASAIDTASMVPANSGNSEGWMLMMRPLKASIKSEVRIVS